jgi:YbbR domain-containing protein
VEGQNQVRIGDWFKKDLKTKIVSLLLALLFWLYVTNVTNPFKSVIIYNVPVTVINEEYLDQNDYTLKNTLRTYIDVTIRGRRDVVEKVKSTDFVTTLDLSQIKSVNDKKLKLSEPECLVKEVTVESYNPPEIDIQLARNKTRNFNVELVPNIKMKQGYVLLNTTVSPEKIQIMNEEATIDSIGSIKAFLELTDLDRDTVKQVQCKVYDKSGKEIGSLSRDLNVRVSLETAKEVPVSLVTRGRLATNYVETQRVIEPMKVLVTGPADVLENLKDIKTEQVDIDKISGNFSTTVPLVVPEGVKLVNSPSSINVRIDVEKLVVRNFQFSKDDISILNARNDGTLIYEIISDSAMVQFRGRQSDLDEISEASLKPAVDVSNLGEGVHRLQLNITLPQKGTLVQKANVEVKISKTPPPEPQEDIPVTNPE